MSFFSSSKPYYLLDKNSLRQMMINNNKKNVKIMTASEMFQNNFEDVNCAETDDQEIERVKSLDIWNIPKTSRARGANISLTTSHSAKQFNSKKIKDGLEFPHIKTELVNRILAEPQEESEASGPSLRFKTNDNEDASKLPLLNYENKKRETSKLGYNEELVHDIIMRKIKEQIKLEDAAKLTLTQLKLQVKAIAEDAVAHFKSLKGILTVQHIQNYVNQTLDMLRESNKKDIPESKPSSADIKNWPQEEKPIINHELSGMALVRELNMHAKESKDLRQLGISIDQAIFKSKKQKAIWEEKLKQMKREIKDLVDEIELASQHTQNSKNYSRRRSAVSDPQRIEDFMQLKKLREEKKAEEEQIIKKLNDIDIKLDRLATESKRTEFERRDVKAKKLYSKVQLKNLYYAMLKDEAALMQNSNSAGKGCIWALKALWNMGEDVKEGAFPAFLDHKAVEFTLKYAKAQWNLETFCAQNHLTEALSPHKTPRLKNTFLSPLTARDRLLIPQSADTNGSDAAGTILELDSEFPQTRQFTKSLNYLRSEYQEKTNAMKRTNLKAKRQVFFGNPLSKDKSVSSRWEEVDPKEAEHEIYYGSYDSPSIQGNEIDSIRKHRSEIKPPSLIKPIVSNSSSPFEKAVELTMKLDELKKEGVEKLTEHYMHKLVDERTKLEVHKIFRFIFGKEEGEFLFHKVVMEKKYSDEKMLIKVKKAQPKKISPDATPALKLNKSSSDTHRHASASLGRSANTPSTKSKFLIPL